MGIGNTTIAAAINLGLYGGTAEELGRSRHRVRKATCSRARIAARRKRPLRCTGDHLSDPLEVMRGSAAARSRRWRVQFSRRDCRRWPVIIDGYVATAAAAILKAANPAALDHCLIGHVSASPVTCGRSRTSARHRSGSRHAAWRSTGAALAAGIVKAGGCLPQRPWRPSRRLA
ncbi:hypothetical protein F2981_15745 [Sinorhizobium meliloti]|nr:hypothetical protein [Sinorhizobium meliloti]